MVSRLPKDSSTKPHVIPVKRKDKTYFPSRFVQVGFCLKHTQSGPEFQSESCSFKPSLPPKLETWKKTRSGDQLPSLKPTASSPLKINGWKMQIPFGASLPMFSGQTCCYFQGGYLEAPYPPIPSPLSSPPPQENISLSVWWESKALRDLLKPP